MIDAITITSEHRAALEAFANNPNGEIARILDLETQQVAVAAVKDAINQPAGFTIDKRGRTNWEDNPPPGPPRSRTGRLWASVSSTRPKRDALGLFCEVTVQSTPRATADARGVLTVIPRGAKNWDYARTLIEQGYVFVHKDPRFKIVERGPDQ